MATTKTARARHTKQTQLARIQEKKAAAKEKLHAREVAALKKGIEAIERRYEPRIEKLHREIREHKQKASEHHAKHGGASPIQFRIARGDKTALHGTNSEGLTWKEWLAAADKEHGSFHLVGAWEAGEDPSEYR